MPDLLWVLFVLAIPIVIVYSPDDPLPDDSDLREYRREVPAERNGVTVFSEASWEEIWPRDPDGLRDMKATSDEFDPQEARRLLEESGDLLQGRERSLSLPDFQVPEARSTEEDAHRMFVSRAIAWLGSCRVRLLFDSLEEHRAIEQAVRLIRFGRWLQVSEGHRFDILCGMTVESHGQATLAYVLRRTALPHGALLPWMEKLAGRPLRFPAVPRPGAPC